MLRDVHGRNGAFTRTWLGAADRSAYPVYYAALPAAWVITAAGGYDADTAWRLTISGLAAYASVRMLKPVLGRRRPFDRLGDFEPKTGYRGARKLDPFAMPSGHATMAAALTTSLALSARSPAVTVPLAVWAVSVGISRVWLGVHWPSDVVAGWALGSAIATIVHAVSAQHTPGFIRDRPVLHLALPLN